MYLLGGEKLYVRWEEDFLSQSHEKFVPESIMPRMGHTE